MSEAPDTRGLFHAVVHHPVAVTMVFIAALVFGFVSYQRLPIELMPDISYPTVTVRTIYDGAAPQEVETQVSQPVEEALATLDGLVRMESRSKAGSSDVVLGFDWGTDMAAASQTIRENMQVAWLPEGTERPLILRYDPSLDPFLRIALSMDAEVESDPDKALYALRGVAEDEIKRELESLPGIAAVRVRGGLEREVRVQVREDWLAARKLTLGEVRQSLASENVNIAGGSILEGDSEYLVRTLNEYGNTGELEAVRIRRSDGVLVPLTDVAEIVTTHKEREVVSRLNGGQAVELEVFKEADANVVEVAHRLKAELDGNGVPAEWGGKEGIRNGLPEGMSLDILDDQASFIESAVNNLRQTAISGGLMAVFVLFLFLRNFRATGIIGLAIPVSVVIGFAPLYLNQVSLNLMSLGGLALGVGMLVDNAVVVLESIQRYTDEGLSPKEAAAKGVSAVASAVVASTLTTVAVFAPIAFVQGVAGELFGDLSLAVVSSLLASLAVALFLVPTLSGLGFGRGEFLPTTAIGAVLGPEGAAIDAPAAAAVERSRAALAAARIGEGSMGAVLGTLPAVLTTSVVANLKGIWFLSGTAVRTDVSESIAWCRASIVRWLALPWLVCRWGFRFTGGLMLGLSVVQALIAARVGLLLFGVVLTPIGWVLSAMAGLFQQVYSRVDSRYTGVIGWAIARPGAVVGVSLMLFVASLGLGGVLGAELIPELHQGRFTIEAALPVGTPLTRTDRVMQQVEQVVASHPGVETVYTAVGVDRRADASSSEGEHTARLRVQLKPGGGGLFSSAESFEARVMEDLRGALSKVEDLDVKLVRPALFSFRTPVEVVLSGYELGELKQSGDLVAEQLRGIPGLRDVKSSLVDGHPEIQIEYDRLKLHRLGLDPNTVASKVRDKVQGVEATKLPQGDKRIPLRVQLSEQDRATLDDIRRINVNPELQPEIPLAAVAEFIEAVGPSEIRRVDQQRSVVVSANVEGFDLGTIGSTLESTLRRTSLPAGISWAVAGQSAEMGESLGSMQFALLLAVFLVYVILASTFEHLLHPLVILFSVPLALVGSVGALFVMGNAISVVVFIGLIVLAGVVVNNAIVLVDTVNRLRDDGLGVDAALRKAGAMRLRPILITTATTMLGLFPLALGFGAGAEIQGPLAVTVIGGLFSSTLLTLVVVPVVYRLFAGRQATVPVTAEGTELA